MTTDGLKQRPGDQPLPTRHNDGRPDIQTLVIDDIGMRRQVGIERYGTALQAHNGRDALRDLYEELIDGAMYTRQLIAERDTPSTAPDTLAEAAQLLDVDPADVPAEIRNLQGSRARLASQIDDIRHALEETEAFDLDDDPDQQQQLRTDLPAAVRRLAAAGQAHLAAMRFVSTPSTSPSRDVAVDRVDELKAVWIALWAAGLDPSSRYADMPALIAKLAEQRDAALRQLAGPTEPAAAQRTPPLAELTQALADETDRLRAGSWRP